MSNLGLLCDLYHLAVNGDDLDAAIASYADRVAHVQIADAPGRHQPGTGEPDFDGYVGRLEAAGTTAGWPWSSHQHHRRGSTWLRHDDHRRRHRTGHHGQTHGRPPGQGRLRRDRLQPQPVEDRPTRSAGAASLPEVVREADVVLTMLPDAPDVERILLLGEMASSSPPPGAAGRSDQGIRRLSDRSALMS